jgi:inorganic pyrophosphatase
MDIVVETPKYSFFKYHKEGSHFEIEFFSPLPSIFNYGFVKDSLGADGMENDVIIIGPRMAQGSIIKRDCFDGVVKFIDDSLNDDKQIIYLSGFFSKSLYLLYFHLYVVFKIIYYLIVKKKFAVCKVEGIKMFGK